MAVLQPGAASAEAPNIEPNIYDFVLIGTEEKRMAVGQFIKDLVNGDPKLEWQLQLLDDSGEYLYDEGEPVVIQKLTGVSVNKQAKTVSAALKVVKALATEAEYAAIDEVGIDTDILIGRKGQVEVFIKENGWPAAGNIIAARKPVSSKK